MRAEWSPFSALPGVRLAPFFNKKCMTDPIFLDWYIKGLTFTDIPVYVHIFHSENFEAFVLLVFNELTAVFV